MEKTTGKVVTCKAAVVWGPGEPFVIEQVQVDPPQKMEVRVKIRFTSICHSDPSAWKGEVEAFWAFLEFSVMKLPGVGAAWNTANVQPVAEGARARGASKIIGVDINPNKFIRGQGMGITDFINPRDPGKPLHERIREITEGGLDHSFECVGNSDLLREAFLSTHDGWGFTVILGIHASPKMLPFHSMELFQGRGIIGSVFGRFKGRRLHSSNGSVLWTMQPSLSWP